MLDAKSFASLWVAGSIDESPKKLNIDELKQKFGFKYSEDIWIPEEQSSYEFGSDSKDKEDWKRVKDFLKNQNNDKFVVRHISEEVGYGVFTKEKIKAGTIVAIYAGVIGLRNVIKINLFFSFKLVLIFNQENSLDYHMVKIIGSYEKFNPNTLIGMEPLYQIVKK